MQKQPKKELPTMTLDYYCLSEHGELLDQVHHHVPENLNINLRIFLRGILFPFVDRGRTVVKVKGKVKQSPYRPGVAQRVPGN
jgi:hypothetical protein